MRYHLVVTWCCIFLSSVAPQLAGAQTRAPLAKAPVSGGPCTADADCPNGICGSDGICGLVNAAACTASVQCRSSCGTDGYCGLPAAVACTASADCRGNKCNADGACAYLMGALCDSAYACRSGVCQRGFCVPFCAGDSSCARGATYCDVDTTTQCLPVLADGARCNRDAMCRGGLCGTDGLCGGTDGQACTTAAACRSGSCAAGLCAAQCAGDSNCPSGRYCDATTQTCTLVQPHDAACDRNAMCRGDVCELDGLCGAAIGQTCTDPQVCRSNICSPNNVCATTCTGDDDCDNVHFCSGSQCIPRAANGATCSGKNVCLSGICNASGTCGSLNGGFCADKNSCLGLACQPQDVRCGLVNGFACTSSAQCRGGFCGADGVCATCTQNSDCPLGLCDSKAGTCSIDARYAGLNLQGGGCAQGGAKGLCILAAALALGAIFRRRARLWAIAFILGSGSLAQAQVVPVQPRAAQGFTLQRYSPTDPGQLTFRVDRPWYAAERARLAVGLTVDYNHKPLVYKVLLTGASPAVTGIVNHQFNATLQVAGAWFDWWVTSVQVPFVLAETGRAAYGVGPSSPAVGTTTLRSMVRLIGHAERDAFSLHSGGVIGIPEGGNGHAHDALFNITPKVIAAGMPTAQLAYAASVGVGIRPNRRLSIDNFSEGNVSGSELQLGAALAYTDVDQHFSVGPEVTFDMLLTGRNGTAKANSSLEILIGGTQRWDAWRGGLAVGMGFLNLTGTPDWRFMARLAWAPGAHDQPDTTPAGARDNDGILDGEDACPDQPGSASTDPQQHGCPGDRDGDDAGRSSPSAADPADREPTPVDPERVASLLAGGAGQPPQPQAHAAAKGPALVTLGKHSLILAKPVTFKRRSAALAPEARPALLAVAEFLAAHPEVRHVTIEAHTDNTGKAQANRRLSQKRADAVRQFLLQRNIASRRIAAKGMGSAHPVAPNTNAANRQRNMRVTFVLR